MEALRLGAATLARRPGARLEHAQHDSDEDADGRSSSEDEDDKGTRLRGDGSCALDTAGGA